MLKSLNYFQSQILETTSEIYRDPYFTLEEIMNNEHIELRRANKIFNKENLPLLNNSTLEASLKISPPYPKHDYFINAIYTFAQIPTLIQQVFLTKEINGLGYYEFCVFFNGQWMKIFIDDLIPWNKITNTLYYTNSNNLWVVLLEKVIAKLAGSYNNLENKNISDLLLCLTGGSCKKLLSESKIELWSELLYFHDQSKLFYATTMDLQAFEKKGLIKKHTYSIISVLEKYSEENSIRLIKLYSPVHSCLQKVYLGDWGNDSWLWDEELETFFQKSPSDVEKGYFYMSIDDFFVIFNNISLCKLMLDHKTSSFKIDEPLSLKPVYFILLLEDESEIYFQFFFQNSNSIKELKDLEKNPRKFSFILSKFEEDNELSRIESIFSNDNKDLSVIKNFSKGKYLLWMECFSKGAEEDLSYVMRISSNESIECKFCGEDEYYSILSHIILSNYKKTKAKTLIAPVTFEKDDSFRTAGIQSYIFNNKNDKPFSFNVKKSQNSDFKYFLSPEPGSSIFNLTLNTNDYAIVSVGSLEDRMMHAQFYLSLEKKDILEVNNEPSYFIYNKSRVETLLEDTNLSNSNYWFSSNKIKFWNYVFPSIKEYDFSVSYKTIHKEKWVENIEVLEKINSFVYYQLQALLEKENRLSHGPFIIKKEVDGLYFGQPRCSEKHIGVKIYDSEDNSGIYIGYWKNNSRLGYGIMFDKEKLSVIYVGEWKDSNYNGKGQLTQKNNLILGEWVDGQLKGYAHHYYPEAQVISFGNYGDRKNSLFVEYNLKTKKLNLLRMQDTVVVSHKPIRNPETIQFFENFYYSNYGLSLLEQIPALMSFFESMEENIFYNQEQLPSFLNFTGI
jgi:hypothetical protein